MIWKAELPQKVSQCTRLFCPGYEKKEQPAAVIGRKNILTVFKRKSKDRRGLYLGIILTMISDVMARMHFSLSCV